MSITVTVESNLDAILDELDAKKAIVLEAWGQLGQSEAKVRAAVDTGDLRRSIQYDVKLSEDKVDIGCNKELGEHAPYVEFGTSKTEAQPFLAPSLQENTRKFKQIAEVIFGGG